MEIPLAPAQVYLLVGMVVAGSQTWYALYLHLTLPPARSLPSWMRYGPFVVGRKRALFVHPAGTIGITLLMLLNSLFDGRKSFAVDTGVVAGMSLGFGFFVITQALNAYGLRRWFAEGRPAIAEPLLTRQSMTALIPWVVGLVAVFGVLGIAGGLR